MSETCSTMLLRYFKSPVAPHYWDIIEIHVCQRPVALCYWDIEISLILNCFCATCYAEVPYLCYKYIMGRDFVVYLILFIFHNTQIMLVVNYLINSISKKNTRLCWWPMVRDYTISISQKDTDHILKIYFIIITLISGSYINTKCIPVCAAMVNILQLLTHFLHLITINPMNLTFSTHIPHTLS